MFKQIWGIVTGVFMMLYPLALYFGLEQFSPRVMAAGLFVLLIARIIIAGRQSHRGLTLCLLCVAIFCLTVAIVNSELLLKYYPALMNSMVALLFSVSLFQDMPLIERFLRVAGKAPPAQAIYYLRQLTKVWAVILFLNAAISAYTACCMGVSWWAFYNSFLSYVLILLMVLVELIFRQFYKRRCIANAEAASGQHV